MNLIEDTPRRALTMDCASCYVLDSDHDAHRVADLGVADGMGSYSELVMDSGAFPTGLPLSINFLTEIYTTFHHRKSQRAK
jgi:hypothetical protein